MPDRAPGFYWVRLMCVFAEGSPARWSRRIVAEFDPNPDFSGAWNIGDGLLRNFTNEQIEIGPRVESPEEMRTAGAVTVYVVERYNDNKDTDVFVGVYGTADEAHAQSVDAEYPKDYAVGDHAITSPDLRRLRSALHAMTEERDQALSQLGYAQEQIEALRKKVIGGVNQVAAPVERR